MGHKDTVTALVAAGANVNMKSYVSALAVYDEEWDCVHVFGGVCVCTCVCCVSRFVCINKHITDM